MLSGSIQTPSVILGGEEDGVWSCLSVLLGDLSWSGFALVCGWACPSSMVILGDHHSQPVGEGKAQVAEEILATVFVPKGKGFSPSRR